MFKSILKSIGLVFAKIGLGAAKTAVYVSSHADVISAVSQIAVQAGAPTAVVDKSNQVVGYVNLAGQVITAIEASKNPPAGSQ